MVDVKKIHYQSHQFLTLDPLNVLFYRPISLLPTLNKVFEICLLSIINKAAAEKNLIHDHQFGFRKKQGTTEQLHRVVEYVQQSFERRQYVTDVFLDVLIAFDKI